MSATIVIAAITTAMHAAITISRLVTGQSCHDETMEAASFQKQVTAAKPRLRLGFIVALLVTMACGILALLLRSPRTQVVEVQAPPMCTPLDADTRIADPAMTDIDRVTCLAIAGKIDAARTRLFAMSATERSQAIATVFSIAHPIADRGDDRSAGPIMALVVEFWPENYMAVFHAGMAEFALGHDANAKAQLERFLGMYARRDVWHQRAEKALADIAANAPLDRREAHFKE